MEKKILKHLIVYIVKSWRIINESKWSGFGLKSYVHACIAQDEIISSSKVYVCFLLTCFEFRYEFVIK
jgi:hypothetical protein